MTRAAWLTARWRDLVMCTYRVPDTIAAPLVPVGCEVDRWDGHAHVSLVAVYMERVRLRGLALPGLGSYPQVNLRLYLRHRERPAVRFVQELVSSRWLAAGARWLYGEPFRPGAIEASFAAAAGTVTAEYRFGLDRPRWRIAVVARADAHVPEADSFEHWIKERVRGCHPGRGGRVRTFDVSHPRWAVRPVIDAQVEVDFAMQYGVEWNALTASRPVAVLYATGSEVSVSAPT